MITRRDPEWNDGDRAFMLAIADIEADLHICGHPLSESLAWVPGEQPEDYVLPVYKGRTQLCLACLAEAKERARWADYDEREQKAKRRTYPDARVISVVRER